MPMPSSPATRRLGAVLAATGLAAILEATLFPSPRQAVASAATPILCLVCGEGGGTDVFLNLLLFAPMAVGLRLLDWPWRRVVAAAALLSLTVEYLQYSVVVGRDPALSDVLANTTGAAVAAALAPHLPRLLTPDPARASRLLSIAAALFLGVLTLSSLGLEPRVPPGRLWSACSPYSPAISAWPGTLRSVVFDEDSLPCDRHLGGKIRTALNRGQTALRIDGVSSAPPHGRTLVYAVSITRGSVLRLMQEGRAAVLSVPTASQRLRLSPVSLQLRGGFPSMAGVPFELRAGQEGRRIWISSSYSGRTRSAEITLSPPLAWSTIMWWRLQPSRAFRLLTAIWLGALILPAGYWAGFVKRPVWGLGAVVATLVAGLAVVPSLTGYPVAQWWEWVGGTLGSALGWALHRFATYLQSRCGSPSTGAYSSS